MNIDLFLFERYFAKFKNFVEEQSGEQFFSFFENTYTNYHEAYKERFLFSLAHQKLKSHSWEKVHVGKGIIAQNVIDAIEINEVITVDETLTPVKNNLFTWQAKYGPQNTPHFPLKKAVESKEDLALIEGILYSLFKENIDANVFDDLIEVFGKQYGLLSYLFFLKDKDRYAPVSATKTFDKAFEKLGVDFKTTQKCSWSNYVEFNRYIQTIQNLLQSRISSNTSFTDAHSFLWMIQAYPISSTSLAIVEEYKNLPSAKSKESLIQARIGQGVFKQKLIEYWGGKCSVTGCDLLIVLQASHIKPWADCAIHEILNVYNGLLLSPALDKCFSLGLISFKDDGQILISPKLTTENQNIFGIIDTFRLTKIENPHKEFLAFHRKNIFQSES